MVQLLTPERPNRLRRLEMPLPDGGVRNTTEIAAWMAQECKPMVAAAFAGSMGCPATICWC